MVLTNVTASDLIPGAGIGGGCGMVIGFFLGLFAMMCARFLLGREIGRIKRSTLWFCAFPTFLVGTLSVPFAFVLFGIDDEEINIHIYSIFFWIIITILTVFFAGLCLAIAGNKMYNWCEQCCQPKFEPWDYYEPFSSDMGWNKNREKSRTVISHGWMVLFGGLICACIGSPIGSVVGMIYYLM